MMLMNARKDEKNMGKKKKKAVRKKRKKTTLSKPSKTILMTIDNQIAALQDMRPGWAENLTFNEMCYVMAVASIQSDSFGNYTRSYLKAGYPEGKWAGTNAHRLQNTDKIQKAIDEYKVSIGKIGAIARPQVLDMALSQYWKADKKGDSMACLRAIELIARMAGLNQDKLIISPDRQALLDETQLIEQQRLTARLIEDHMDAEVVDTTATVVEEKSAMADKGDYWDKNEG